MKALKKLFYFAALAAGIFTSCSDDESGCDGFNGNPVSFTSSISNEVTRASGTSWGVDAIGVYMVKAGETLAPTSVVDEATNKKYTTTGNGKFVHATPDDMIYLPEDGSKVDFISYYPYQETINDLTYPVDVANQTDPTAIDLLYSANAAGIDRTATGVNLTFDHMLSNLVLNVADVEGRSLSGLAAYISGMPTKAGFSLADVSLSVTTDSKQNINAVVAADGSEATVNAIVLPTTTESVTITFQISGRTYIWEVPDGTVFDSKNKYTYDVNLKADGDIEVLNPNGSINDWTDNNGGNVDLGEDGNGGQDPGPEPGVEVEFFKETFGDGSHTTSATRPKIGAFDGWSMEAPIVYSDEYGVADIRSTSTMDAAVWFPANNNAQLLIEGINELGLYKDVTLSYDIAAQTSGTNANHITVKVNGNPINGIDYTFTGTNAYQKIELEIGDNVSTLEFFSSEEVNLTGFRVDNITLKGTK